MDQWINGQCINVSMYQCINQSILLISSEASFNPSFLPSTQKVIETETGNRKEGEREREREGERKRKDKKRKGKRSNRYLNEMKKGI